MKHDGVMTEIEAQKREMRCPFCNGTCGTGKMKGRKIIFHSIPSCNKFDNTTAEDFFRELQSIKGRN